MANTKFLDLNSELYSRLVSKLQTLITITYSIFRCFKHSLIATANSISRKKHQQSNRAVTIYCLKGGGRKGDFGVDHMVFMRNGGGAVVANRAINNDRFLQMLKKRKIINTFRSNHVVYVNSAVFVFRVFFKNVFMFFIS